MAFPVGTLRHEKLKDVHTPHWLAELEAAICSETEADSKITTHQGDASAHHTKTSDALEITSGRFGMARMPDMAAGKVMVGQGAGNSPVEETRFNIFDKFRDFIPCVSLDGFTTGGDIGCTVAAKGVCIRVEAINIANSDAFCYSTFGYPYLVETSKLVTVEFFLEQLYSKTNQNVWLRLGINTEDPPNEVAGHFGFKIIGGASVSDLYASNADNSTQTITDTGVDISAGTQRTRLKVVLNPGTYCKFYVNDVLKVTHTTHLPPTLALFTYFLHFHVRTLEASNKFIEFSRVLIEKEN